MKLDKLVVVLVALAVLLSFTPVAIASDDGRCEETVNPHGKVIPPAGSSTAPGLNPNSGINPDGFFNLSIHTGPGWEYVNFTIIDLGADSKIGGDGKNADRVIGTVPYQYHTAVPTNNQLYQLNIKYTEANGAKPNDFKPMATFGKDTGQSDAVAYHFKGVGDFGWKVEGYSPDNGGTFETEIFIGCLVPPPPKNVGDLPVV